MHFSFARYSWRKPLVRPAIGDKVLVTALVHKYSYVINNNIEAVYWDAEPITPKTGVYVGYRYKNNGFYVYNEYEGPMFRLHNKTSVAWVVFEENKNPSPVKWTDISLL